MLDIVLSIPQQFEKTNQIKTYTFVISFIKDVVLYKELAAK